MSARDILAWQQAQQQAPPPSSSTSTAQPGPVGDLPNGYGLYNCRPVHQHPTLRPYNADGVINKLDAYPDASEAYSLPSLAYATNSQRDLAILSKGAGHMLPHAAMASHNRTENAPVFDMSEDFPALGSNPAATKSTPSRAPAHYGHVQQPGFVVRNNEAEFPTLGASFADQTSSDTATRALISQQQQQQSSSSLTSTDDRSSRNRFGLQGLLGVIRMTDADRNTLALGTDLTTLGLNLNSTDVLYPTFASPWADGPSRREPDYILPYCYYRQPPALKTSHLTKFQLETLFYIFYNMPKDMLQVFAAKELYAREWKYHPELKLWFARPSDVAMAQLGYPAGTYVYFDTSTWERRVYPREHSDSLQFMLDEEIASM